MNSVDSLLVLYPAGSGESTDAAPGFIEIENFPFGVSHSGTSSATGQGQNTGTGKVTVFDFHLTGTSTVAPSNPPTIFKLDFTKSAGSNEPTEYLTYELKNVFVSSYHAGGGDDAPTESIHFNFTMIAIGDSMNVNDTSGNDQVFVHTTTDQDIQVENDETHWVGQNPTSPDETLTIFGQPSPTGNNDQIITLDGANGSDGPITIDAGQTDTANQTGFVFPIQAADEITISTGGASITMDKDGTMTIPGSDISIQGSGASATTADGSFNSPLLQDDGNFYFFSSPPPAESATPHQLYVEAVYEDVLGRAPDAGGLAYWSQMLDNGASPANVAQAIAHSDEYYAEFEIMPDYVKLLGRPADDVSVKYWTSQMDAGLSDQQLEADLVSSAEFYTNAGGTNTAWIDAVYKLLLGRSSDASGESYWNSLLAAGQTLNQVAQEIAGSQENNTQLINDDYFHYLGRAADAGGLAYWLQQFQNGQTNEDVIAAFTGSAEYYKTHTS